MYIIIAIIAFGLLIAVHELGHFTAAKLLGVRVNEFAIGMGPKILKKQGKETLYSLRVFPFGGFCAMDEDNEAVDSRSFTAQKRWRRVVILAAGGFANILAAFIIVIIIVSGMKSFGGTTLAAIVDGFPDDGANGLQVGDTILSINGERIYYTDDFLFMMDFFGKSHVDVVIRRDGEKITLNNYNLVRRDFIINGESVHRFGLTFNILEANLKEGFKHSCYMTYNFVRLIRLSIAQLISGAAGVKDLAGPVAIVDAMNNMGQAAPTVGVALLNIAQFTAFIGVNIALVNFLPIPAMDGGRILFTFVNWVIEKITRRKLNAKYEGYIHMTMMVLLMGLMVFILINDVLRIIRG